MAEKPAKACWLTRIKRSMRQKCDEYLESSRPALRVCVYFVLVALVAMVIVHFLFRIECPVPLLVATWSSGELLGFIGSVLGAIATILAVTKTIGYTEKSRQEDLVAQVLPCIVMETLEHRNTGLADVLVGSNENQSPESYEEGFNERDYAIIAGTNIKYASGLDEQQQKNIAPPVLEQELCQGVCSIVANTTLYIPLVFKSVGIGPAVNVSLALIHASSIDDVPKDGFRTTSIKQMPIGSHRYFGLYFENRDDPDIIADYQVFVRYYDILGNEYRQGFGLSITNDVCADSGRPRFGYSLSFEIVRKKMDK